MSFPFTVIEHTIPGQHIREYPRSIRKHLEQETTLHLAIKQYIPLDLPTPVPDNAITIIGAPGNATPKEVYEPIWEDLYADLKKKQIPLRGIWVADGTNHAASGVLNEYLQGDQASWYDHSRDLLYMINHFRDQIPRPIIGVAHSMGCAQLINLAIIHPRLLSSLVLYEPVLVEEAFEAPHPVSFSSRRRDLWPSSEKAKEALSKSFKTWDPRSLEKFLKYGIRSVPTALYDPADPKVGPEAVTLTTSKHQESWSFSVLNLESEDLDRLLIPDWHKENERPYLVSRPECWSAMRNLPYLRPSILWVFGGKSYLSPLKEQEAKMRTTGTGTGGNGGVKAGAVEKAVLPKGEHLICFEQPSWCASVTAEWIQKWFKKWLADEKFWEEYQSRGSDEDMLRISKEGLAAMKMPTMTKRGDFKFPPKGKL
ncbi:hypothetical protein N7540_009008 [Penicillium herquei]|nr:hypothetical protein N7540_009008 [Penicillium herquei]